MAISIRTLSFTELEDKILDGLSESKSNNRMARELNYSPSRISEMIEKIGRKLGIVGKVNRLKIKQKIMELVIE